MEAKEHSRKIRKAFYEGYSSGRWWSRHESKPYDTFMGGCPYTSFMAGVRYRIAWGCGFCAAFGVEYKSQDGRKLWSV